MPDVVGQTQAQAVSTLQAAGFTVVVEKVPDAVGDAPAPSSIRRPSAGVVAQPGSSVTILVAESVSPSP